MLREKVKRWWHGELLTDDSPHLLVIRIRHHWTARVVHAFFDFFAREWKWSLTFLVALVAVIVAIKKL